MSDDELAHYLRRLTTLTQQGKIDWQSYEKNPGFTFLAILTNTAVWIYSEDLDDFHPYVFTIDRRDDSLDINDPSLEITRIESSPDPGEMNDLLARLYSLAKGKALNLDVLKKQVFSDLDDLE